MTRDAKGAGAFPPPTSVMVKTWRTDEGMTQVKAASIAGVELRTWQRWEASERAIPQWLGDILRQRWGTSPGEVS